MVTRDEQQYMNERRNRMSRGGARNPGGSVQRDSSSYDNGNAANAGRGWESQALPAPAPAYQPQQYQYPVYNGGGGGYAAAAPQSNYAAAPTPAPQPKPVMTAEQWKAGDSTLVSQNAELNNNYKDFLARLNTQRGDFTRDFDVAKKGFDRNEVSGLLSLGEDFTSRGLANSGLFANANQEATANYQNQRDSMDNSRTRSLADFTNQDQEKKKATELARKNNESASLARMAAQQSF